MPRPKLRLFSPLTVLGQVVRPQMQRDPLVHELRDSIEPLANPKPGACDGYCQRAAAEHDRQRDAAQIGCESRRTNEPSPVKRYTNAFLHRFDAHRAAFAIAFENCLTKQRSFLGGRQLAHDRLSRRCNVQRNAGSNLGCVANQGLGLDHFQKNGMLATLRCNPNSFAASLPDVIQEIQELFRQWIGCRELLHERQPERGRIEPTARFGLIKKFSRDERRQNVKSA